MRVARFCVVAFIFSLAASAQTYTIQTVAGGGLPVNIPGTSASLSDDIFMFGADQAGNLYFSATGFNAVLRWEAATGLLSLVAGNAARGYSGDGGPAANAQLNWPVGAAVDSAGNVYIADTYNYVIRRVSNGVITTIAGNGVQGFSGDGGPALEAQFTNPMGLAVDSAGNLYVMDEERIRRISNGVITTVAGTGTPGFSGVPGPTANAQLDYPQAIAVDPSGNLYIAQLGGEVLEVSGGMIRVFIENLGEPDGVAVDLAGNVYISDRLNNFILKVSTTSAITILPEEDYPAGLAVDGAGNIYLLSTFFDTPVEVRVSGAPYPGIPVIGGGASIGDGGFATAAQLVYPQGLAVDSVGNLYVADSYDNVVREFSGGGISTVAGDPLKPSHCCDGGPAVAAGVQYPAAVAVDSMGNLYIAAGGDSDIREVADGIITTVAGAGSPEFGGDGGPATEAGFNPTGVAVDSAGDLYIADDGNNRIRKVSQGIITTIAGNGTSAYSGDGGPATAAELNHPAGVALDAAGDIYIADTDNNCIRKISNGTITTIAGNGVPGYGGDNGPSAAAQLNYPTGIALDAAGNLYIADAGNNRVRKISGGIVTTIAGKGTAGFSGDGGPAASAELNGPVGVAVDAAGNVYVADSSNNRVRVLTPAPAVPQINAGGVVNLASFTAPVAAGSISAVMGSFSVNTTADTDLPLDSSLQNLSLQFGGGAKAPLFMVSGAQANLQVPWELTGQSTATVAATLDGQTGAAQTVKLAAFAPGIFAVNGNGSGQGAILDASYNLVDSTNPATAGSTIVSIYCTGLGAVSNQPATGAPAPDAPLAWTTTMPTVTIGGAPATILFSGLAPGFVGLYQVNALVPAGVGSSGTIPVTISIGGVGSNTVTIAVH